jgi:selenocysteine-specific elongation factor
MNARINRIDRIDDRWLVKFTLLDKPYPVTSGMKFLIRLPSPKITVAGGNIVYVGGLKGKKPDIVQIMKYLVEGDAASAIKKYLEIFCYIEKENLYQRVLLKEGDLKKYEFVFEYGKYFFYKPLIESAIEKLILALEKKKFVELREVFTEKDPLTRKTILENFISYAKSKGYEVSGNTVSLSGNSSATFLEEVLDAMIKDITLTNAKLIAERINKDEMQVNKALIMLGNRDQVKKLDKNGNYIATVVFKKFMTDAVMLAKNDRYVDIGNIRKIIDAPRKILIPLLEFLDKTNLFKNIDNKRYLK